MPLSDIFRSIIKLPLTGMMKTDSIRRRIVYEIRSNYFEDLEIDIPLGSEFTCPLNDYNDAWGFSEIFVKSEYAPTFDQIPLPRRWLDLGCHIGYFSLFVSWLRANRGQDRNFQALLVDADSRVEVPVEKLIDKNKLGDNLKFKQGLIADGQGRKSFFERTHMSSSGAPDSTLTQIERQVEVITPDKLFALLEPPYDLVKVDVEGGEYDFLTGYRSVLKSSRHLIIEWHSWHPGGGSIEQIHTLAKENGFELLSAIVPAHEVNFESTQAQCGVCLYENKQMTDKGELSP